MRHTTIPWTNLMVDPSTPCVPQSSSSQPTFVELSDDDDEPSGTFNDDDYMTDKELAAWIRQQNRVGFHLPTRRTSKQLSYRTPMIANSFRTLSTTTATANNGVEIKINLNTNVQLRDGDFMRVKCIVQNTTTQEIKLRGWLFRRTHAMKGWLGSETNELCWLLRVCEDDLWSHQIHGMEEVKVDDVSRRRAIRLTNRLFPELSWREEAPEEDEDTVFDERVLVCRYKCTSTYANAKDYAGGRSSERRLARLRQDECDRLLDVDSRSYSYDDCKLRSDWRGDSPQGGACERLLNGEKRFLLREWRDGDGSRLQNSSTKLVHRKDSLRRGNVGSILTPETPRTSISSGRASIDAIDIDPPLPECQAKGHRQRLKYFGRQTRATAPVVDLIDENSQEVEVELASKARRLNLSNPLFCQKSTRNVEYTAENSSAVSALKKRSRHDSDEVMLTKISKPFRYTGNHDERRNISPSLPEEMAENGYNDLWQSGDIGFSRQPISDHRSTSQRRYTFGDCFCGAGGTSRGAVMAGLRVEWGFDSDLDACQSYAKNFYQSRVYHYSAEKFYDLQHIDPKVDILHLSPPCQFFSAAHTTRGKNDEKNSASLFAVSTLLIKTRPRVVTLEQTAGLETEKHGEYFNRLVHMFTSIGFSVSWRKMDLRCYGVPQTRTRLIMIASCPGEPLPPFLPPTHSDKPMQTGLKPFVTINDAISQIPDGWDHHEPEKRKPRNDPPYDGDTQSGTMTTSANGMVHPSGTRSYTNRELACLQCFGLEHKLTGKEIRRQIGNAVPPVVAKVLFEGITAALKKADGLIEEEV